MTTDNNKKQSTKRFETNATLMRTSVSPAQDSLRKSREVSDLSVKSSRDETVPKGLPLIDLGQSKEAAGVGRPTRELPYREPKAMRIEREGYEAAIVRLDSKRDYVFGRARECNVVFPDDAVSRRHGSLIFRQQDQRWVYRDLNSSNHSYLGDQEASADGDGEQAFRVMKSSHNWVVEAGHVIFLGKERSRIVFLAEVPLSGLKIDTQRQYHGSSAAVKIERSIEVFAQHELPILILGKPGVGKTHCARKIHERSGAKGQFILVNCNTLPHDASALAKELLGNRNDALTGLDSESGGKIYRASGGTLFLDNVEVLPRTAQDLLVDVLDGNIGLSAARDSVRGEPATRFRLILASTKPLAQTNFQPDFIQRLAMAKLLALPTLDERREDIPNLVEAILLRLKAEHRHDAEFTSDAIAYLQQIDWPGQIRELDATIRSVVEHEAGKRKVEGIDSLCMIITLSVVKEHLAERNVGIGSSAFLPWGEDSSSAISPSDKPNPDVWSEEEKTSSADAPLAVKRIRTE